MDVTNIKTTDYSSYVSQAQTGALTDKIGQAGNSEASDAEMLAACKEFEAYMVEQLYKQAQKMVKSEDDEDSDNAYADYAYDLQAQQYAKLVSEQGKLGLAQQLYESMKKQNAGITPEQFQAQEEAGMNTEEGAQV